MGRTFFKTILLLIQVAFSSACVAQENKMVPQELVPDDAPFMYFIRQARDNFDRIKGESEGWNIFDDGRFSWCYKY